MATSRAHADPVRIGATVRALRVANGWRSTNFARTVGISTSYLSNIEAGRRTVQPDIAVRIANTLGVPLAAITTSFTAEEIAQ